MSTPAPGWWACWRSGWPTGWPSPRRRWPPWWRTWSCTARGPWGGAAEDVTLSGLRYPLDHGALVPDRSLGVSNEFLDGQAAQITVGRGTVLALWTAQPSLPLPERI